MAWQIAPKATSVLQARDAPFCRDLHRTAVLGSVHHALLLPDRSRRASGVNLKWHARVRVRFARLGDRDDVHGAVRPGGRDRGVFLDRLSRASRATCGFAAYPNGRATASVFARTLAAQDGAEQDGAMPDGNVPVVDHSSRRSSSSTCKTEEGSGRQPPQGFDGNGILNAASACFDSRRLHVQLRGRLAAGDGSTPSRASSTSSRREWSSPSVTTEEARVVGFTATCQRTQPRRPSRRRRGPRRTTASTSSSARSGRRTADPPNDDQNYVRWTLTPFGSCNLNRVLRNRAQTRDSRPRRPRP